MMNDEAHAGTVSYSRKAKGVREMLSKTFDTLDFKDEWFEAFGTPERYGVWIIWGNSANGKTSFAMQLCKHLCRFGRVAYDSLEEGAGLSMRNTLERYGMLDVNGKFMLIDNESIEELSVRLKKRRSPDFIIIDSFQYAQLTYKQYIAFKEKHPNKLLIFISHADGNLPNGRAAKSVMYDASLKIYIEGFRAFSKGRFIGPRGYFNIWPEGAEEYWGAKLKKHEKNKR